MESETNIIAKERLLKIDQVLDEYEKKAGLSICKSPGSEEELDSYLSMDRTAMEALQLEDCAGIGCRLAQYSFYIQRLYNREKSRTIWAKQQLMDVVAKSSGDYDKFTKFDVRVSLVTKDNEFANSLQKIVTYAEQRAQRLEFLATSIKNIGDAMKNMQMAKSQMARG